MRLTRCRRATAPSILLLLQLAVKLILVSGCQESPTAGSHQASAICASCHLSEFENASDPPHSGVRPTTCGTCHSETSWHPDRLKHSWLLEGAHAKASCFACHSGKPPRFEGSDKACLNCHRAASEKANTRVAHHETFPVTCEECHSTTGWKPTLPHAPALTPSARAAVARPSNRPLTSHPATTVTATGRPANPAPKPVGVAPAPKPVAVAPVPAPTRPPDAVTGASRLGRK
jgi:hypothetical protein